METNEDWMENLNPMNAVCKNNLLAKKKVKLYSPIAKSNAGYTYLFGRYTDTKDVFRAGGEKIIGWHEIEVEVDE